ncbi:hypothetical protein [Treponema pectinovorum]|uniref:hypothetical protein n=1 Tax=Treponema pectinovorum TaxID=164 RepID=UPI0011CA5F92|nr:hypothetical protein [Treponema pectinovorum]
MIFYAQDTRKTGRLFAFAKTRLCGVPLSLHWRQVANGSATPPILAAAGSQAGSGATPHGRTRMCDLKSNVDSFCKKTVRLRKTLEFFVNHNPLPLSHTEVQPTTNVRQFCKNYPFKKNKEVFLKQQSPLENSASSYIIKIWQVTFR